MTRLCQDSLLHGVFSQAKVSESGQDEAPVLLRVRAPLREHVLQEQVQGHPARSGKHWRDTTLVKNGAKASTGPSVRPSVMSFTDKGLKC